MICFFGGLFGLSRGNREEKLSLGPERTTFLARADFPQELPGINAEIVAVVPMELDGVFANAFGRKRFRGSFEHGQRVGCARRSFPGLASRLLALIVAHGAGAGVKQVDEIGMRGMAVVPRDMHSSAR